MNCFAFVSERCAHSPSEYSRHGCRSHILHGIPALPAPVGGGNLHSDEPVTWQKLRQSTYLSPREAHLYLMTEHGTFLGVDDKSNLVQLAFSDATDPRLVRVEETANGFAAKHDALSKFDMEVNLQRRKGGISFRPERQISERFERLNTLSVDRPAKVCGNSSTSVPDKKIRYISSIGLDPKSQMKRFVETVLKLQAAGKPVKLYCGAGPVPRPGFLNLDIKRLSASFFVSNPDEYFIFPFAGIPWDLPDDCVDYVFHEDFMNTFRS